MSLPDFILSDIHTLTHISRTLNNIVQEQDKLLCKVLGNYFLCLAKDDVDIAKGYVGCYEPWVTIALAKHIQPGFYCVDAGANYGYHSVLMAAACGATGKVLSCEPNPYIANIYLPETAKSNGFQNIIEICPKAIGDKEQEEVTFALVRHGLDSGLSPMRNQGELIRVPMTTIDALCEKWPRIDLIKMDVEGAEYLIWKGMQQTLKRSPNITIVVELHLFFNSNGKRLLTEALDDGYVILEINRTDGRLKLVDYVDIVSDPNKTWHLWIKKKDSYKCLRHM